LDVYIPVMISCYRLKFNLRFSLVFAKFESMIKRILLFLLLLSGLNLSAADLESERRQYEKYLQSMPVLVWKSLKVAIRSGFAGDSVNLGSIFRYSKDSAGSASQISNYANALVQQFNSDSLSANQVSWQQNPVLTQIWKLRKSILKADEDVHPVLMLKILSKERYDSLVSVFKRLGYKYDDNSEHLFLAICALSMPVVPEEIVHYELSAINFKKFPHSLMKQYAQLLQAQFIAKRKWFALANEKFTSIIEAVEKPPIGPSLKGLDDENGTLKYHFSAMVYYARGLSRFYTNLQELRKPALEDIGKALKMAEEGEGHSKELYLASAYLKLASGKRKSSLADLKKASAFPGMKTPDNILAQQTIAALENKKDDEAGKILQDAVFYHYDGLILYRSFLRKWFDKDAYIKGIMRNKSSHPIALTFAHFLKIERRNTFKAVVEKGKEKPEDELPNLKSVGSDED